jgi:hypothetical protein
MTHAMKTTDPRARVLAVVEVLDEANDLVNEEVVRHAAQLASDLDGELHVATSYPAVDAVPSRRLVVRYLPALNVKARDRRRCAIAALLRKLRVRADAIHVEAGLPGAIDALAVKLHARITVVASARNGIPEILIRDTEAPDGDVSTKHLAFVARQR